MEKLTERQRRFVDEYLITANASDAARRAGYAPKNCDVQGAQLLVKPSINAEIKRRLEEVRTQRTADLQETLEFTTSVMRGEILDNVVVNVGTGRGYTQPRIVEVPTPLQQRLKAAEFILKVNGAFQQSKADESKIPDTIKIICADHSKGGEAYEED